MDFKFKALYALVDREVYWLGKKIEEELSLNKKIALFPAGPTAQVFYQKFLTGFGMEADIFIDNNPNLEETSLFGKPVLREPWKNDPSFADKYSVLVPVVSHETYSQITTQLEAAGIGSYISANAFWAQNLWERYKAALPLFDDDLSRVSYLASIYDLLTNDSRFIQYTGNTYFALKNFATNNSSVIVDAGAFVGDTVEEYVKRTMDGKTKIYAFEPFDKAFDALEARVERLKKEWLIGDSITLVRAGLGAETATKAFSMGNPNMLKSSADGSGSELPVYSLDDYFKDKTPFTLLKADIEGAEMDMLRGASGIISRYKPKMTLCIYHSPGDFIDIIEYVKSLVPEYKLAVRNHYPDFLETVLYCWI